MLELRERFLAYHIKSSFTYQIIYLSDLTFGDETLLLYVLLCFTTVSTTVSTTVFTTVSTTVSTTVTTTVSNIVTSTVSTQYLQP